MLIAAVGFSGLIVALAAEDIQLGPGRATGGGQILQGDGYTLVGAAGQPEAGRLAAGAVRVNGGVIGESVPRSQPPEFLPRAYLPLAWRIYPAWARLDEVEPNNLFSQANPVTALPALVAGAHDGAAGGGDVFSLELEAGKTLEVTLSSGDGNGVQLLAYDAAGAEIDRDYTEPYNLSFDTTYTGAYFVYVFSDPQVVNTASYSLRLRTGNALRQVHADTVPVMDEETVNQPPRVELAP